MEKTKLLRLQQNWYCLDSPSCTTQQPRICQSSK